MLTDLCENYFQNIKKETCSNNTLYEAGLDTVIVYVGQRSEFLTRQLEDAGKTPLERRNLLEGEETEVIDEATAAIISILDFLNLEMKEGIDNFNYLVSLAGYSLIATHFLLLLVTIMFIIVIYLKKLNSEQKKLVNIIKMTPLHVI